MLDATAGRHRLQLIARTNKAALAGGVREGEVTADLYGFLTTEPNAVVAPIHSKVMPVILMTEEERELSMRALVGGKRVATAIAR